MNKPEKKYKKRTTFLPTVLSMSLVLFMLGLLGLVMLQTKKITDTYRENFEINIFFEPETDEKIALNLQLELDARAEVKKVNFISSEEALKEEQKLSGELFLEELGYNPLPHSLSVLVKAEYASPSTLKQLVSQLKNRPGVAEVDFPLDLMDKVKKNLQALELTISGLALVFLIIAIGLINNTIRLNLFARRFLIKSMQYVGATNYFIIRPFILMYIGYGAAGFLLAILGLAATLLLAEQYLPYVKSNHDWVQYAALSGILLILGTLIVVVSTWISTRKYLRMNIDRLY